MVCRGRGGRVLVIVLATVSSALATAACGSGEDSAQPPAAPRAAPPATILEHDFAVFRRPRTPADVIPERVLPRYVVAELGLERSTSRLARRSEGKPVYVVTSPRLTCIYSLAPAIGNCWPTTTVAAGMATATSLCGLGTDAGEIVTYGIVPDGVDAVTVLRNDEPDRTARVVGNVYIGTTTSTPPLPVSLTSSKTAGASRARRASRRSSLARAVARASRRASGAQAARS